MTYLAALRAGETFLFLSEAGTWIVPAAFEARGSMQKLRTFRYEESARGVAEEWAKRTGYVAHIERAG